MCDVVLDLPLHLMKSVEKKGGQVFCTEKTLMSAAREVGLIGLLLWASAIWDLLITSWNDQATHIRNTAMNTRLVEEGNRALFLNFRSSVDLLKIYEPHAMLLKA